MGLFKKKQDPLSDRARDLNKKIAALEAEIKRLSSQPTEHRMELAVPDPPAAAATPSPANQPKLRSTALPHGAAITPHSPPAEPVFEEVNQRRLKEPVPKPEPPPDLGIARSDFNSIWRRFRNNFRGPATSNPKLVNYLAAGSIQGLRPLRYEKRVARNRFIVLASLLILLLWGFVAVFLKHR
jgi:hypothetical protein